MKAIFFLLTCSILLIGCSVKESNLNYKTIKKKGITITINNNIPSKPELSLILQERIIIENNDLKDSASFIKKIDKVDFDKYGNIYIMDGEYSKIHKYNTCGKYLQTFGNKGKGPGEFEQAGSMIIKNDTIYIPNWSAGKLVKFNLNGNYLCDKTFASSLKFPSFPSSFGPIFVNNTQNGMIAENGKKEITHIVSMYDKNFNYLKNLYQKQLLVDESQPHDPYSGSILTAQSNKHLFLTENSESMYKIDIYDLAGNKISEIHRKYRKLNLSKEDIKSIKVEGEQYGFKYAKKYKNAINWMLVDKKDRLWVNSASSKKGENNNFDIFEDGIFLNRIKMELDQNCYAYFLKDKLISVNYENWSVKIFDYSIE